MAKKNYKTPEMTEVKVNVEDDLLSISGAGGGQTCADASECDPI